MPCPARPRQICVARRAPHAPATPRCLAVCLVPRACRQRRKRRWRRDVAFRRPLLSCLLAMDPAGDDVQRGVGLFGRGLAHWHVRTCALWQVRAINAAPHRRTTPFRLLGRVAAVCQTRTTLPGPCARALAVGVPRGKRVCHRFPCWSATWRAGECAEVARRRSSARIASLAAINRCARAPTRAAPRRCLPSPVVGGWACGCADAACPLELATPNARTHCGGGGGRRAHVNAALPCGALPRLCAPLAVASWRAVQRGGDDNNVCACG